MAVLRLSYSLVLSIMHCAKAKQVLFIQLLGSSNAGHQSVKEKLEVANQESCRVISKVTTYPMTTLPIVQLTVKQCKVERVENA